MLIKIGNAASRFVDLVHEHVQKNELKELPAEGLQVLLEIVSEAGFDCKEVVPGQLLGDYLDQGGRTGEKYKINSHCIFKVVDEGGKDNYLATGWLDCAFRMVRVGFQTEKSREEIIEAFEAEVEKSVPLDPIQLTVDGDMLREYPPRPVAFGLEYFVEHTRDEHKLSSCVGVHMHCNGWMDRRGATDTRDAIICRECHLRVLFPKTVETYGGLRKVLQSASVPVEA